MPGIGIYISSGTSPLPYQSNTILLNVFYLWPQKPNDHFHGTLLTGDKGLVTNYGEGGGGYKMGAGGGGGGT